MDGISLGGIVKLGNIYKLVHLLKVDFIYEVYLQKMDEFIYVP